MGMTIQKRIIFSAAALVSFFAPGPMGSGVAAEPVQYRYAVNNGSTEARYTPVITQRRRRYVRRNYYSASRPRYVVKRRSKGKSAAIIGGSAAAGAGIGALAGGGKGAGIGAIAGGAAGLIYDRKTHKKVVREY
jgi:outer membrane lipoprotein SlyB